LSSSESTIEDFEEVVETLGGDVVDGMDLVKRLVVVDQKPIGRTPRSRDSGGLKGKALQALDLRAL
jgi:excinuclease UvrABC ATPase subunit